MAGRDGHSDFPYRSGASDGYSGAYAGHVALRAPAGDTPCCSRIRRYVDIGSCLKSGSVSDIVLILGRATLFRPSAVIEARWLEVWFGAHCANFVCLLDKN